MNRNELMAAEIIDRLTGGMPELRQILWTHSRAVADMALECAAARCPGADCDFVEQAALLHDVGIVMVDAPSIHCFGTLHYICHGVAGAELLSELGMPRHALVCERHTGAGLSVVDIVSQNLPLPHRDMLPLSQEERLICYADKFYSKSGVLTRRKPLDKVIGQMRSHGGYTLRRFMDMHRDFGLPAGEHC